MNLIKRYLTNKKIRVLPKEETYRLIGLAQSGCEESRNKLIEYNLPLVMKIASSYSIYTPAKFDDMFQEGIFGLSRAIEKFDVSRNLSLSTYAVVWIKQSIMRYVQCQGTLIRYPVYAREIYSQYKKLVDSNMGRDETYCIKILAKKFDMKVVDVTEIIVLLSKSIVGLEVENSDGENHDLPIGEDDDYTNLDFELLTMSGVMTVLSERERAIVEEWSKGKTLQSMSKTFGLTRERIRQLKERALYKLRRAYRMMKHGIPLIKYQEGSDNNNGRRRRK